MTIFSTDEFDELRGAFYRCNLKESVQPRSDSGRIIDDPDTYNRAQVLLETPDMEEAHGFLYDIDWDHLTEPIVGKVNDLYELAVDKGFIEDERVKAIEPEPEFSDDPLTHDENPDEKAPFVSSGLDSAYTCLYTAMKDGQLKTGECFSNAKDTQSAKADAISKLANLGFTSIEIIAVEQGDSASRGEPSVANADSVETPRFRDYMDHSDEIDDDDDETEDDEEEPGEEVITEDMVFEADDDETAEGNTSDDPLMQSAAGEDSEETAEETEDSAETEETETGKPEETEETSEEETEETVEEPSEEETVSDEEEISSKEETEKTDGTEEKSEEDSEETEKDEIKNKDIPEEERKTLEEKYVNIWNQILKNMEKESYRSLTVKEMKDFHNALAEKWEAEKEKYDPSEFLSDKRIEKLETAKITL